jgi:Kef-type K+ transport system membrane component KefB
LLVGIPLAALLAVLSAGRHLRVAGSERAAPAISHAVPAAFSLGLLVLQVAVVLLVARLVGLLFKRLRQPQVIGEMVAGIMLGPSLLGWVAPDVSSALFPTASLGYLNALSQIGLVFFMFLVGVDMNSRALRERGRAALLTSHASIVTPFCLGAGVALLLYPRLATPGTSFTSFALFIGSAMSITAYPVLARILTERNLLRSRMGTLSIACAAVDDSAGWCILAYVVVLVQSQSSASLWITLSGTLTYVLIMLIVVRPLLRGFEESFRWRGRLTDGSISLVLLLALGSAFVTERLGIHSLFGAFFMGAVMPKRVEFVDAVRSKLESLAVVALLPLFFAFSGLRTNVGLVQGQMWLYTALVISTAVAGKFGGSSFAAWIAGMPWRDAAALGILMNTRGLMELVALNIGLDIGVISPQVFTIMVLMALVTTFMTSPLLGWVYPVRLVLMQDEAAIARSAT